MPERYDMNIYRPQQQAAPITAYTPQQTALPSEAPEPSIIKPILRQWWIVALFVAFGILGALSYIATAKRLYTSQAKIYIAPASAAAKDVIGVNERASYLETQASIISSTPILQRVAQTDGMRDMKTFVPDDGDPVLFLRDQLDVELERKTDLIVISLESPYPDEAAKIVNAVVDAYGQYSSEDRSEKSNSVLKALNENKKTADDDIATLQKAISDFHIKNPGIIDQTGQNTPAVQKLQQLGMTLTQAKVDLVEKSATYSPNFPAVVRAKSVYDQINSLYQQQQEIVAREGQKLGDLTNLVSQLQQKQEMQHEVGERIHAIQLETQGQSLVSVDVVEPARVADFPSSPRKNRAMAIAIVLGGLLGAGVALLRDRMDGRMRTIEEIQQVINMPILGVVPAMSGRRTAIARAMTVHLDPRSVVAEAFRTIRTAVYFGATGSQCKTLLITSPEPGDGKTTTASNLAIAIAQTGRSVLLLDADFRKPTQHKNLDVKDAVGLSSVLAGRSGLQQAIQHTSVDGLDILACGPIPANPSEILNSREFGELIDSLATRYDHIIFDSPPINAVTDARILGAVCDATILVLRADKTTRKASEHARNALLAVGARTLGAVVNDAPNRKGYEVYGGYYYGSSEHSAEMVPASRRLSAPTIVQPEAQDDDQQEKPKRRDIA